MSRKLKAILNQFQVTGTLESLSPIEIGHINQTYKVNLIDGDKNTFWVLQRINTNIFKQPIEVMDNIVKIGHFLAQKNYPRVILNPIKSQQHQYFVKEEKHYWRLFPFVSNTLTYNEVNSESQAYAAAFAFGEYARYLNDFDATSLHYTIPDFHNTNLRFHQFSTTIKDIKPTLKKKAQATINRLLSFRYLIGPIKHVKLPLRVTHNDTKINNILFDRATEEAVCVIDLDTLMPGTLIYDYGDMVRTFTPLVDENSEDYDQVCVRKEMLIALTEGYIAGLDGTLTYLEEQLLMYGAKLIIFEQALRFLTDYLKGNIYYKVAYQEQNLVRAKNQLCLLESLVQVSKK